MSDNKTTREIRAALCRRYGEKGQYLIAHEVGSDLGFEIKNYADIIAISNWKSRGLGMLGFEIKASRSDWQKELRSPQKAEAFLPYCTEWWIAAAPGIVKKEELPTGWGLMELTNGSMRVKHACVVNRSPQPCPWPIAVMIMRRLAEGRSSDVREAASGLLKGIKAELDGEVEWRVRHRVEEANQIVKRAQEIKAICGKDLLGGYTPPAEVASALEAAAAIEGAKRNASWARNHVKNALRELDLALGEEKE